MLEIEVKILGIDMENLEKKIISLGGVKTFQGTLIGNQYDFCEDHPNNLHKQEMSLRLRKEGVKKVEVTFKKFHKAEGVKHAEETPVGVDDFQAMHSVFESLGLQVKRSMTKERVSYSLPKYHVHLDIDTLPGCPPYLEVEGQSSEDIRTAVKALGYTMAETNTWNQFQVLEFYKKIAQ